MARTKTVLKQIEESAEEKVKITSKHNKNSETIISTGSTLLDLAIGGGLPGGILVEIFGPNASGKTVLLCEIAGAVQRQNGNIMFHDPEARLNKQFAMLFDVDINDEDYNVPDTVTDVFKAVRKWQPKNKDSKINGIFADSLAALSTNLEMDKEDGDKMGARRAKEFSEELRKTCRIIKNKNYLMVCSNQIRETMNAFGAKYASPGGKAIGFYASLRLKVEILKKIKVTKKINEKPITKIVGIQTNVEVFKNSISAPYKSAPITIIFDYGIDDIRENLQYVKENTENTIYQVNDIALNKSLEKSILLVEKKKLVKDLQKQVIRIWNNIDQEFQSKREKKERN